MKNARVLLLSLSLLALATPAFADERITDFSVDATLAYDRRLVVTEAIKYDFGDAERHGIYRIIPDAYDRNGAKYKLKIAFTNATVDGQPTPWVVTREGDDVNIRIGDANKTVTGTHYYVFTYETSKAVNDFSDHRELYWNVTGNGWPVSIEKAQFKLVGPALSTNAVCYTGAYGSSATDCTVGVKGVIASFATSRALEPGEGLTFAVAYPLDAMRGLTFKEKFYQFIEDNLWSLLPLITLAVMYLIWRKWGKEPIGRGTIVAQYEEPRGLPPALMASLMEQKVSGRAISATILDLARRGYLKIRFEGEPAKAGWFSKSPEITFVKVKQPGDEVAQFEFHVWKSIFEGGENEVKPKDLEGKAYKEIALAKSEIQKELSDRKWFGMSPIASRSIWAGVAVFVIFQSFFLAAVFGGLYIFSSIVSAIIIFAFGWQMPQMSKEGAIVKEECEGFKLFLSVTEKARLAFTDAPERRPDQFARFLPAAVAFGVEEQWAGQFASFEVKPPSYMEGNFSTWNALAFAQAMNTIHTSSAASMYHAPSSAGGGGSGFSGGGSGGGFGGGGGGSW